MTVVTLFGSIHHSLSDNLMKSINTTTNQIILPPSIKNSTKSIRLLEKKLLESNNDWKKYYSKHEHARQLQGTVGDITLKDETQHRGSKCFDSFECSWYYHTRHPGKWGDCDAGTCLCEPGYKGANCEKAPPANRFSCSDGACYDSSKNGRQSEIRGGNLTVTVVEATNLPDTDGFGVFGGESDAFVQIQIGNRIENLDGTITDDMVLRKSCKVRNDLNPIWNESDPCANMSFGVQQAGKHSYLFFLD